MVDTEEEQLDTLTVPAWRRTSTVVQLTREGATEYLAVDPSELHKALMRDGAQPDHATPSPHSSKSRVRHARNVMSVSRVRPDNLRTRS